MRGGGLLPRGQKPMLDGAGLITQLDAVGGGLLAASRRLQLSHKLLSPRGSLLRTVNPPLAVRPESGPTGQPLLRLGQRLFVRADFGFQTGQFDADRRTALLSAVGGTQLAQLLSGQLLAGGELLVRGTSKLGRQHRSGGVLASQRRLMLDARGLPELDRGSYLFRRSSTVELVPDFGALDVGRGQRLRALACAVAVPW